MQLASPLSLYVFLFLSFLFLGIAREWEIIYTGSWNESRFIFSFKGFLEVLELGDWSQSEIIHGARK